MWARPWRTWSGTIQRSKCGSSSQKSSMKSKVTQVEGVLWSDVQSYDSKSGQRRFVRWCHTKVCFSELQWMTHQFLLVEGAYPKARVATSPSTELVVVSVGFDPSAVEKLGYRMVRRVVEELTKIGRFGKNHPMADGRGQEGIVKLLWQEEDNFQVLKRIIVQNLAKLWSRAAGHDDGMRFCRKFFLCDVEGCGNQHVQFNITQFLFEVVHDVEGGRTRAVCSRCLEKDNVFSKIFDHHIKVRAGAKKHQQMDEHHVWRIRWCGYVFLWILAWRVQERKIWSTEMRVGRTSRISGIRVVFGPNRGSDIVSW